MSTIQAAKEIANTLRPFSGRSEHLEYFINAIDKFFDRYGRTADNSLSEFVFAAICSKIIDEAGDFLLCRHDLNTWPEIKQALRTKFGDKTDRNVLQQQFIYLTKNRNESIAEFLDRLKLLKMRLNLKINSDVEINAATKMALIDQNEVTAVTVLISNCNTELRTLLMLKNPRNIEEATSLVVNHSLMEQHLNLLQNSHHPRTPQKFVNRNSHPNVHNSIPIKPHNNQFQNTHIHQNRSNYQPPVQQRPNNTFPNQPIKYDQRSIKQHFPTNSQVFGKPTNVFSQEIHTNPKINRNLCPRVVEELTNVETEDKYDDSSESANYCQCCTSTSHVINEGNYLEEDSDDSHSFPTNDQDFQDFEIPNDNP
ncbi:hypothetical protein HHI36_005574 [Cryptolaemus montrouzieri]|uniref:Retrotransposon gag domain-containing protein n=1 Tax=Cryptolaemus montrouzieri TaxID=559131 RepID=A0ABD2NUT3_9CUCU